MGQNGVISCRVLYPLDSEYGLQIISTDGLEYQNFFKKTMSYSEAVSVYNNMITRLNSSCAKYVNADYALQGRSVGSNPKNPSSESGTPCVGSSYTHTTCKGADNNYVTDWNQMTKFGLVITGNNSQYILASRYGCDGNYASIRRVFWYANKNYSLDTSYGPAYYSGKQQSPIYDIDYCIRPVIKIREDVIVTSGNGKSVATAYTFGKWEKLALPHVTHFVWDV